VLTVTGDVDLSSSRQLKAEIAGAAESLDPDTELVVDLSGVAFLDSTGLRALLRGADAVRAAGARLSFVLSPPVRRVLELTSLTPEVFGIRAADWTAASP
jgi:anti-anti-sigma factor